MTSDELDAKRYRWLVETRTNVRYENRRGSGRVVVLDGPVWCCRGSLDEAIDAMFRMENKYGGRIDCRLDPITNKPYKQYSFLFK